MDTAFEWYVSTTKVHFGAVVDSRTGRKGLDIHPMSARGSDLVGMAFQSNGVDEMVWEGSHYRVGAIRAMVQKGWVRKASKEETQAIQGGKVVSQINPEAVLALSSDEILESRLKKDGLVAQKTQTVQPITLEELKEQKPEVQKQVSGLPQGWDIDAHWTNRKAMLEQITDMNSLLHLNKYYDGTNFKKHVEARISKLSEQVKNGAVKETTPVAVIPAKPQPAKGDYDVDRSKDSAPNAPLQGTHIDGLHDLRKIEEPESEATASFEGGDPMVGPKAKKVRAGLDPKIETKKVAFDK